MRPFQNKFSSAWIVQSVTMVHAHFEPCLTKVEHVRGRVAPPLPILYHTALT